MTSEPATRTFRRGDVITLSGGRTYAVTRTAGDRVWYSTTGIAGQSASKLAADLDPLVVRQVRSGRRILRGEHS